MAQTFLCLVAQSVVASCVLIVIANDARSATIKRNFYAKGRAFFYAHLSHLCAKMYNLVVALFAIISHAKQHGTLLFVFRYQKFFKRIFCI